MTQQTVSWVFSGIGVTVILTILGLLKFIFVPHPIIFITLEEKAFLTGYQRIIRKLFIEFSIMLILLYFALFSTNFNNSEHQLITTFPYTENQILPNSIIVFFEIVALILLILFLTMSLSEKLLVFCLKIVKQSKMISFIFIILFTLYFIVLNTTFGYTINWIFSFLNSTLHLNQKQSINTLIVLPTLSSYIGISVIVILIYVLYRLLIQPVIIVFNKISNTVIVATITLTNGTKLYNKYILRPSVDGNILIGDKPKPTEDCDKIMLPKTSILLIEFKRVYKSTSEKETTIKRILLPPDFK